MLGARVARPIGGPLLATIAVVLVLLTFFQPAFLTNDDMLVEAVINGEFTGKRSSALVIVPAIFGHILRVFYLLFPHLNWYSIGLFYTLQIVAWSCHRSHGVHVAAPPGFGAHRRRGHRLRGPAVDDPAGGLHAHLDLRRRRRDPRVRGAIVPGRLGLAYTIAGGVLLGVVDFVRTTSFLGLLVLFAPCWPSSPSKPASGGASPSLSSCMLRVPLGDGTSHLEYSRTPQWRASIAMNGPRGRLSQTPRLFSKNVSDADLANIGWTGNHLYLFADDEYPDPSVYTDKAIEKLAVESPLVRRSVGFKYVYDTLRNSSDDKNGPVVSGLVALGILVASRRNRFVSAVIVASVVWAVVVLTVLLLYERLPGRIGVPFEAGAALLALIVPAYLFPSSDLGRSTADRPCRHRPRLRSSRSSCSLRRGPSGRAVKSPAQISSQDKRGLADVKDVLTRDPAHRPQRNLRRQWQLLLGRWFNPLTNDTQYRDNHVIPLGLATNSPWSTARLARSGVSDVYTALQTNPHVHLLASGIEAASIQRFYRQHRHTKVRFIVNTRNLPVLLPTGTWRVTLWSVAHTP